MVVAGGVTPAACSLGGIRRGAKAAQSAAFVFRLEGFGLTVEPGGRIAAPMIDDSTSLIARRRRIVAVWAVVCV